MNLLFSGRAWLVLLLCMTGSLGCGPRLCEVSGMVSVDSKPAPAGLKITFQPRVDGAEPILSVTENDGSYRLIHRSGSPGVPAGTYTVSVGFWGDSSANPLDLAKLKLPDALGEGTSTLVCDVRPGGMEFNIDVKTVETR